MTSPHDPDPIAPLPAISQDPLLDTLPGAVIAQQESAAILRVGVVAAIVEGYQITVRISGSEALINCSYLFGQYFPLMGDRVVVLKQDSQWICLGEMSGAIDSNNPLFNPSFEDGVIGVIPTGWTLVVGAVGAGVPFFIIAPSGGVTITGIRSVDFGTVSVGAGTSTAEAFSTPIAATPSSRWTGAFYLIGGTIGSMFPTTSTIEMHIEFLDAGGVVLVDNLINTFSVSSGFLGPIYRRMSLSSFPDGFVVAPAGTAAVRATLFGSFTLPAGSNAAFFIDNVILREVQ